MGRLAIFASRRYLASMALTSMLLSQRVLAALEAAGLTQAALAAAIDMDAPTLSKALSGKRNFRPLELARIADVLSVSVQALLADDEEPAEPTAIAARARPHASDAIARAVARAEQIKELHHLLTKCGFPAGPGRLKVLIAPSGAASYYQGEWLAQRLRESSGLGSSDLPAEVSPLTTYIEDNFLVDVAAEPLDQGVDGLAVSCGEYKLILINSSMPAHRQRYTLGHELGHLVAGDGSEIVDENINIGKTPEETRANAFAAAFLMPEQALRAAYAGQSDISEQWIADLLARYRVSLDALALRLPTSISVTAQQRDQIRRMSSARISLRQGRANDLQARKDYHWPGGVLERAVRAYMRGAISIRPLAALIYQDPDTLLQELAPPRLAPPGTESSRPEADELVPNL